MTTTTPELRAIEGVQLRAETDNGRRYLSGTLVPYNKRARIGGFFDEEHAPGSFAKSIREAAIRLPLMAMHDHQTLPIGSAERWDDDEVALRGYWLVADTQEADDIYGLVKAEHLGGLSVGFQPIQSRWTFAEGPGEIDSVVRLESRLLEASVVPVPTWKEAVLTRTAEGRKRATPRADQWRAYLNSIKSV